MIEVVFLSGADSDMDEIYARLEESDRGERFLLAVDARLTLLRSFPRMAPREISGKVRKVKLGRTPYGLYYTIEGRRLMVVAVQDLRQDPPTLVRLIRSRL